MDVTICDVDGPDGDLLPMMDLVAGVVAELQGGLPPRRPERELALRRVVDPGIALSLLVAGGRADPDGVGQLGVEVGPNAHVGHIDLWVRADRRRRGTGSVLLAAAEGRARAAGCTTGMVQTESAAPSGRSFFEARGYVAALVARCNRLLLDEVDRSRLREWLTGVDPAYDLVLIDGPCPAGLVAAQLQALAALNDAPLDDLELEDEAVTAERLRASEARVASSGERRATILALHAATGEGAGFTSVRWDPEEPTVLWQRGTAVARRHRGHRLGRRLKAAMLLHLLATVEGAAEVRTENAGTNRHMLAINDALGFVPWAEQVVLQKRL